MTASLDALDVMSLSNKLLAGFARGRVETRRSQRQAYFAWRAHVREVNRLRARAEMVGLLYEKKVAAAARDRVGAPDLGASRQATEPGADVPEGAPVARAVALAAVHAGLCSLATGMARKSAAGGSCSSDGRDGVVKLGRRQVRVARWRTSRTSRGCEPPRDASSVACEPSNYPPRLTDGLNGRRRKLARPRSVRRSRLRVKRRRAGRSVVGHTSRRREARGARRERADVLFERRRRAFKADAFFVDDV